MAIRLRLPNGFQPATAGSYLQVAILPRTGWYPATELASDIGLLAFLAWLLAFGTHDLSHALQRSRAALTTARARMRTINKQLATEMQQRLSLQETFDHARFHDAFTGLPNRRYFMDQLDRALRDVRTKRRQRVAVIIVDISRFKLVNDMLGHTAGDELMVQAARRFEKSTSAFEGVLARWGGDQFAVLILDVASTEAAMGVAGLLQEELRTPFELRRHKLVVTATIGVTDRRFGPAAGGGCGSRGRYCVDRCQAAGNLQDRPVHAQHGGSGGHRSSAWRPTCTWRWTNTSCGCCFSRSSI